VKDPRFDVPLYTVSEAARHLDLAPSTLRYWIAQKGIVRSIAARVRGEATLPFVALAQIEFIRGLRREGLSLRAVNEGVTALAKELGREWLVRSRLAHDGADILVRLAESDNEWGRARDGQAGIPGVMELGMQTIAFDSAGMPERVTLTTYESADVIIDPRFAFGQPVIQGRGVRIEDIAQLFFAGEPISVVSEEFDISTETVEAVVRVYGRSRAA
jgi:uncharacterized protein (DUF433 family)/DNA-binding transcriptional MerR regulator